MTKSKRIRVVIEYDVPVRAVLKDDKARVLDAARTFIGTVANDSTLKLVTHEVISTDKTTVF